MNGRSLSRQFYSDVVLPAFSVAAPNDLRSIAFGLAGPGSECYGYDDEVSRDHDWGPRVCLWVGQEVFERRGESLQAIYENLDGSFAGFDPVRRLDNRVRRDGVISIPGFFRTYLGTERPPGTVREWLVIPEEAFSLCTNGEIFADPTGEFSGFRAALLEYFPRDLWLKKVASRCKAAAQHGQYNLERAAQRGDTLAGYHHAVQFMVEAARLVFLLRRTFRPFSKWLFRGLLDLGTLGVEVHGCLSQMIPEDRGQSNGGYSAKRSSAAVEQCVKLLIAELGALGLADRDGDFLYACGQSVEALVKDRELREGLDIID